MSPTELYYFQLAIFVGFIVFALVAIWHSRKFNKDMNGVQKEPKYGAGVIHIVEYVDSRDAQDR